MRTIRTAVAALALALLAVPTAVAAPAREGQGFALEDGDRVVFFGDSITEQRLYTSYVEHYVVTRFPERRITFVNSGWGGDQTSTNECAECHGVGALARITRDVVAKRPTVVTLLFGMNDGKYRDFDPAVLKVYEDGMTEIIRELKASTKARIYVMTPTVYDASRHTPWSHTDRYNEVLDRYSEAAKAIAARERLPVVDLHAATTEALRRAKAAEPDYTFAPDGVHPDEDGQLVMAAEILRAWGAPADGAEVTVRAGSAGGGSESITAEAPLPWPSPLPSARLAGVWPGVAALGGVTAKISGLAAGSYAVTVDGAAAGTYTAEQLAAGIPVGALSKDAAAKSAALAALVRRRADTMFLGWRQVQVPLAEFRETSAAAQAIDRVAAEMAERERVEGRPHTYRLVLTRA